MVDTDDRVPLPTAPRDHDRRRQQRARVVRWTFMVGLVAFVVAAFAGVFGEHTRTVADATDGYEVEVEYARATRGGLSSAIEVAVRRPDGRALPDTVSLAFDTAYLRLFDDHAIEPTPEAVRADGEVTVWTLAPRSGATELRVLLDGRIDPGIDPGDHAGTTTLLVDGDRVASVSYRTWVWP